MTTEHPTPERAPVLIGITGPIGCGKTTVARMLDELGGVVIDADLLARHATDPGRPTLAAIRERFGTGVFQPDGQLDRAALASIVFGDPVALGDLERIVHPEVRRMVELELERATFAEAPFVVIEAIKLVEGGLADRCDEVWIIECEPATQRERLLGRGMAAEDADNRVAAQGAALANRLASALERRSPDSRPQVRRLSSESSLAETRDRIEDALADAIEANHT